MICMFVMVTSKSASLTNTMLYIGPLRSVGALQKNIDCTTVGQ